ncbi:PEP-CTERM sorting domain-containing protein [Rubritalea tangerina]|uniref:PEP-CTERM sorting domain-containing protein n=1 Tax=Rubritalea tangerina TaxID=430798 RepID=A0ABW4ZEP6_9BACT
MKISSLSLLTILLSPLASAATITWGSAFNFNHTDQSLFLNDFDASRNGGLTATSAVTLISAIDYGHPDSGSSVILNGVQFVKSGGSRDFWGSTGIDPDIDTVLSGHTATGGSFTQTLTGLTIGRIYQIQLIGIHDSRGGINTRAYNVDNGEGDFTNAPVLTRGAYGNSNPANPQPGYFGTVVGTFTADAITQDITLNVNTGSDPGLSGYILHETTSAVPEPSSVSLLGLGSLTLLLRRKRP